MAIRKSYSQPAKSNEPTTFQGKYSLKNKAGLDAVGKEAYVIPLDMASGYVEIPYHTLRKCPDGTGFKNSQYNTKIACHKYDKNTGEIIDQMPLCCRLAQLEKDRLSDKEKSAFRAISFTSRRNIIPVMVLSSTETDATKKASLRKISMKNGIDFSFIDMSSSAYDEFTASVRENMETDGVVDSVDDLDEETLAEEIAKYLQSSIIKITNTPARSPGIPYEKSLKAIPMKNEMVAKESKEQKFITVVSQVVNGVYDQDKLPALFEKYPAIQEIHNQTLDFLELFNNEVDNLVVDWTEKELSEYYEKYTGKQAVVDKYKSEETVSFKEDNKPAFSDSDLDIDDGDIEAATSKSSVAVAEKSEEEFDYSTSDLEESSILEDEDFSEDDFGLGVEDDL